VGAPSFNPTKGNAMKTSSAFKLSKTAKRALAIITNPDQHGAWKKALVSAEAAAQVRPSRREKTK
jgi:hypothetical protein